MTLNLSVLTPNRIIWDSEVKEIILVTNSGQIGVLPDHAPIATAVDIGILKIRLTPNDGWLTMALMGGFARIGNNEVTILVNDAEKASDIDPQEAQQTLEIAEANLRKAQGKRQTIEANLALRRARTRVEAINGVPS
ncbi:ATP synthase CF1 epsilon subunit (chloroplast) [Cucumis sativus]|jgi:F-type H+-transporting ATPase subunit epsilon|uniref:ATP synthase epsilon chain, chloroplastic n=23 Tax=Benincaseae TaxID=1003877 RepID=ATPE_CUCSA|nr:ATP synthase CF1 epsilon subunit [Cucumis melo subsp. melo]YP_009004050.1 ATP synthase CF1 epsilon subunit [Cucumis hystrix]YP_009317392.1 ATP synthase CF1 epsilon subunit [Coccinia grandis]YP_009325995.1 ATP synthase CF1 epsilon subunit [Citrullus lanatus]YP_009348037.1 ATP synthase CF1 epsilon subunit [Citrullus lanatus subsp. mucosospermus]YP_009420800.1 ATP synthase CF1 epsilon subunit [Citrullus colocynthis]YP_009431563.1 ATP synthase CF1 epsilon subunit [Citrullus amarus]YP_00943164